VSVGFEARLSVRFVVRAQRSEFAGEDDNGLFDRARELAATEGSFGYREVGTEIVPIQDPGDRSRTLDTWFEVTFERQVDSITEALAEVRRLVGLEKTAIATRHGQR